MTNELIGIAATLFIIFSMCCKCNTKKSTVWMRVLNLVGSVVFVVYGFVLPAYSTAILNIVLIGVNGYHLFLLLKK